MTNHVLKHEGRLLTTLLGKVADLRQLNQLFSQYLDPDLAKHCQVVKIDRDCLIVVVDNNHWISQLRFHIPDLLPKLRTHAPYQNLKAICSKMKPDYKPFVPRRKSPPMKLLSQDAADKMLDAAKSIKDERLRGILERIARHSVGED
jgi:hypothetical protein